MMEYFKEMGSKFYSDKNLYFLFSIWLLTFFLGSWIGSYSLGFLTIYPNLIVGLFFIPLILLKFRSLLKVYKLFIFFLALFLGYSIFWIVKNGANYFALFELRSHIFYLNTFLIIITTYSSFVVKDVFKKALLSSIWMWFWFIVIIGFVEHFVDIHILNDFYSVSESLFIFGNPNDYILNCLIILFILFFIDNKLVKRFWEQVSLLILLFILSVYCLTRMSELILILLFFFILIKRIISKKQNDSLLDFEILKINNFVQFLKDKRYYILFFTISLGIISTNKLVIGKEKKVIDLSLYFRKEQAKLPSDIKVVETPVLLNNGSNIEKHQSVLIIGDQSLSIRLSLILNGLFLFKSNPVLGVGPGQFQVQNSLKNVPYDIGTNCSPHNYFIELISNYALLGISFLIYLFYLFFNLFKFKSETSYWLKLTFIMFFMVSILPSAFIYQPMNWLFMSLWILYSQIEINLKSVR